MKDISLLKEEFCSRNGSARLAAMDNLLEIGGKEIFDYFIEQLSSNDYWMATLAALGLREPGNDDAVEPLFKAIFSKKYFFNSGSFVYALQELNCSNKLKELFKILFYNTSYESKDHAHSILSEQEFEFTRQDILDIQEMWEDLKLHPEKCPDFENVKQMIQYDVEGYLPYLE